MEEPFGSSNPTLTLLLNHSLQISLNSSDGIFNRLLRLNHIVITPKRVVFKAIHGILHNHIHPQPVPTSKRSLLSQLHIGKGHFHGGVIVGVEQDRKSVYPKGNLSTCITQKPRSEEHTSELQSRP